MTEESNRELEEFKRKQAKELEEFERQRRERLEKFEAGEREALHAFEGKEASEVQAFVEEEKREFVIKIDRHEYRVHQKSLTGSELRNLPKPPIGPDRDLFEVVPGDRIRKSTIQKLSRYVMGFVSSLHRRVSTPERLGREKSNVAAKR